MKPNIQRYANIDSFDTGASSHSEYREALNHIFTRLDLERVDPATIGTVERDLDVYAGFLSDLDNPHLSRPTVHFTGTRGKGSTLVHLESIMNASSYSTGATVSPHLEEVRERIRLNGNCFPLV